MKGKLLKKLTASTLALAMMVTCWNFNGMETSAYERTSSPSQLYVNNMGNGWNLGNSFDGFDADLSMDDTGELAWGNPTVTRELISTIKAKGYDSIRIPMTAHRRYSEVDGKFVMDEEWVDRYKEVVQWSVDEGLYVMVNIHHDSWIWLSGWDGNVESVEYRTFVDLWEQLADEFKDFSDMVCFETINEPDFNDTGDITAQDKLDMINLAAYDAIRNSGGNNDTRMIVIPTMHTNHGAENSNPLYELISGLEDENIIATIHYYSEWVFSANLGRTGFDEALFEWSDTYTPRVAAEEAMNIVYDTFTKNGIGVVVGEWGLLGYDAGNECNQPGEELKYYEYMNYLANERGISLMFWDNGSGIDRRDTTNYSWKKPLVGEMLEAGIRAERSSYSTDLNTLYFNGEVTTDIEIPFTMNGNTFVGIDGLTENVEYTFDRTNNVLTLKKEFVNNKYNSIGNDMYGDIADLVIKFSAGADWHQYLVKNTDIKLNAAEGTREFFAIPTEFNGSKVRRMTAYDSNGNRVGPQSEWWLFQQYGDSYEANYDNGTIEIYSNFLKYYNVIDGSIVFDFELYDGKTVQYNVEINGDTVKGIVEETPEEGGDTEDPEDNNGGSNGGEGSGDNDLEDEKEESKPVTPETKPETVNPGNNEKLPQTGQGIDGIIIICLAVSVVVARLYLVKGKKSNAV